MTAPLLTVKEAASYLRCGVSTLNKLRVTGGGPKSQKENGRVFYKLRDLDIWIDEHRRTSTSDTPYRNDNSIALYRHFDARGNLLYVGISLRAVDRLIKHRQRSAWFNRIARVDIEYHPTREAALAAELKAIRTEGPLYNIAGRVAA